MLNYWQQQFIIFYALINVVVFLKGFYESRYKKNAFGRIIQLTPLGVFVWGDAVVLGLFWFIISLAVLLLNNWYLFLLIISIFWVVRSFGETIYWFNQQFSPKVFEWNRPKNLLFHWVFHNDSIWFVNQIFWQCVCAIALLFAIYFGKLWLA